jgi:hypothetical protein
MVSQRTSEKRQSGAQGTDSHFGDSSGFRRWISVQKNSGSGMSALDARLRPGGNRATQLADVRDEKGSLLAQVDEQQTLELLNRKLVTPRGRHYVTSVPSAIQLWARAKSGGRHTTDGRDDRVSHRALRSLYGGS